MIKEHEPHYKPMVNSGTPDWKVVPAPLVPLVTNLVIYKSGMMTGRGCHYDKRNIHVYVVLCGPVVSQKKIKI